MARQTNDEFGNPIDETQEFDPAASRNALTGGVQGVTDPNVKSDLPGDTDPSPATPAADTGAPAWDPGPYDWHQGESAPRGAPADQHWDAGMANFAADAPAAPAAAPATGYQGGGDQSILSLLQQGMSPQQAAQMFNQTNGRSTGNEAVYYNDNRGQTIGLPGGYAALTPNGWTWTVRTPEGPAGPAAPAAAPAQNVGGASVGPNTGTSAYNEQMRQILLKQIQGLSAPTTAEDPEVAPAIGAFNTQSQRDQATNRDALAERFYAQGDNGSGLNSGGFNTSVQQGLEKSAGDRANFTGSTILAVAQQKRQQLQQMLQTATQAGLTDAAQQIQAKIAELDANLRQQGISNQASQFTQAQAQQQSQYGDSLGLSYSQLLAQANRDALLAGLQ